MKNKIVYSFLLIFTLMACQKEAAKPAMGKSTLGAQKNPNDFSDLQNKKDESCDSEEDLEKKIKEQIKKKEFKLQGGNTDCVVK